MFNSVEFSTSLEKKAWMKVVISLYLENINCNFMVAKLEVSLCLFIVKLSVSTKSVWPSQFNLVYIMKAVYQTSKTNFHTDQRMFCTYTSKL